MEATVFVPPSSRLQATGRVVGNVPHLLPSSTVGGIGQTLHTPKWCSLVSLVGGLGVGAVTQRSRRLLRSRKSSSRAHQAMVAITSRRATESVLGAVEQPPDDLCMQRKSAGIEHAARGTPWPAPMNDRLLRAARGEPVDRPPKWMYRQAGRYLPEYMQLLEETDFFSVCRSPALAAEITLQPYRRYPTLDSLIIFSDILVIPVAMGMDCHMEPDVGPRFEFSLSTPEDMEKLNLTPDVESNLGYVFDAVYWTRQRVEHQVPVIGFAGAPWTLMGYMVEGGAARSFDRAKKWLYLYPEASRKLLGALRDIIVEYLVGQYDAGAPLLTIFDTNCGELPPDLYQEFCVADLKYIATEVKRRRPHALLSVFPKDGEIACFNDSDFDVVAVSWTSSPAQARKDCPDKTLQGNLDPFLLYADPAVIYERSQRMVHEFGAGRYIANLGHGMMPSHPVEGPAAFIAGVDASMQSTASKPPPAGAQAVPSGPSLALHMPDEATVTLPVAEEGVEELKHALAGFMSMFKEKTSSKRAQKLNSFEFSWSQDDGLTLEVFCNPNAFATIFDVKMLVTLKYGTQINVVSELPLSVLQSDLAAFGG